MEDKIYCSSCKKEINKLNVHTDYYKYLKEESSYTKLEGLICIDCIIKDNKINKLYHVSPDCGLIDEFVPRIPDNRAKDEDAAIPRICLSDSIDGCILATPWGGSNFEEAFFANGSYLFRVYEFDIEDIDTDNLIPPEYLYYRDLVTDSYFSNEYWYKSFLKPSRSYLIEIEDYEETYPDNIKCLDYIKGLKKEEMSEEVYWDDLIDGFITEIYNVKYSVVAEDERVKYFELNHKISELDEHFNPKLDITNKFESYKTWVEVELTEDGPILKGEIFVGNLNAINRAKFIDYLNFEVLDNGSIL